MKYSLAIACLLMLASCGSKKESTATSSGTQSVDAANAPVLSTPLNDRSKGGETLFTKLEAKDTGVTFINPLKDPTTHPLRRLYASSMVVGGVAVGDVDGDGRPDLFFVNGPTQNGLFRQTADFTFEDITAKAGVDGGEAWGVGTAMVDIENDGDLDIYVCNHGTPNQLFLNNGKGTFTESAKAFGIDLTEASHTPAFCDYDLDGNLDLFLLTNKYYHPSGKLPANSPVAAMSKDGKVVLRPEFEPYVELTNVRFPPGGGPPIADWEDAGRPDHLYRNTGNGTFRDVTEQVGMSSRGWGLSATWWDYNDDGYPDLYVGNDFNSPDYFYRNNGDGSFTNVLEEMVPHTTWFSMGADFGDLNQDGWFDFLIADMSGTSHYKQKTAMGAMSDSAEFLATAEPRQYMRNALYLGTGQPRFMEGAYLAGLAGTDWTWTVKICDFDNDGQDDVYFTNGMSKNYNESDNAVAVDVKIGETQWDRHTRAGTPELREQNIAYQNHGDLNLEDVSKGWGLDHVGMSFGSVHTDLDRDGDLDLVVVNLEEPASVYRNDGQGGNRVLVSLQGTESNPRGIGARVTVETADRKQRRQNIIVRGYMASHEPILHFGLGDATTIDRLIIDWPSGHRQEITGLAANHHHTVTEPNGRSPARPHARKLPEPLFKRSTVVDAFQHVENNFDDFQDQPLLPNKQSQYGPGLALGDVDGDGQEDFLLSSAAQQVITMGRRKSDGTFERIAPFAKNPPMKNYHYVEELGLLLFEADGDGDLDLYTVGGGSEYKIGTNYQVLLQDRLYRNDGKGNFRLDQQALPQIISSGGTVVTGDWDGDGDLDLFVGGRVVGGKYPTAPNSYLLRNDGNRFADVTDTVAPGLRQTGMVTSALFTDVDNDGRSDLLVAHEWGPVKYYHNSSGGFTDETESAGLAPLTGWWNSLASADFDRDGDMDYVVGNFGKNTKYHASKEKPTLLYYGDFDRTGTNQIIEAEFEEGILYPVRGRSCSMNAMPHLANKFQTYHDWGMAPLQNIYEEERLKGSLTMSASTLESGVLINDNGKFTFKPLPHIAQIAPIFGVVAQELDGDGIPDLYVVQNFYGPQVETGHMDGGMSLFLRGKGDGSFEAVSPDESGLIVTGDAKGLAITDLNGDARPDFLISRNKDTMVAYENHTKAGKTVMVRLKGPPSNPSGIGARITLKTSDGASQTAEMLGGSGYLSQSTAALSFGLGQDAAPTSISVRWPNGTVKAYTSGFDRPNITLSP
ncbi:MAG: hypothetical protein ACI8T1_004984 [Verrucomicrobiales bacterium]|jgi:hypothetical protein